MTIWELVEDALTPLAVPFAASRYLLASGASLPEQYLVYQLITSPPELHADNQEQERSYRVQVTAWSRAGFASLPDVSGAMAAAGFVPGAMRELPMSEATRHFGLALEFVYAGVIQPIAPDLS